MPRKKQTAFPEILNLTEFMGFLRIGYGTALKLLNSGEIPHKQLNREWRIPKQGVLDWLNRAPIKKGGGDLSAGRLPTAAA